MLKFGDCKPGWVVMTKESGNQYVVSVPSGGYNAYRLKTHCLYTVNIEVEVEHIGYVAIETVPKAPEFISVPHQ